MDKPRADIDAIMIANVDKLHEALESIELHGAGEHSSTIQEIARISVALTTACAEVRQAQKQRIGKLPDYTDDELVEHLQSLPERRRETITARAMGVVRAPRKLY